MSPLLRLMGRGALAGALAGLLATAVAFIVGEPSVNEAIEREHAAGGAGHAADVFTRATQQAGLGVASVLAGAAVGLIFGLVYAVRHRDDPANDPWGRALWLAAAGFAGLSLIPFLRYPPRPPAVGDPATIDLRTQAYFGAVLIGAAAVTAAWQLHRRLLERGATPPLRQLAALAVVLAGLAATFLLPGNPDPNDAPAELIWSFRIGSLAAIATVWFGLGAIFGLLSQRAAAVGHRRDADRARAAV
jgi:hypothetical protein